TRLRLGADFIGTHVALHSGGPRDEQTQAPPTRGETFSLDPADFLSGQPYESVPTRSTSGVYGELELEPVSGLTLALGARADLWMSGSDSELALSPNGTVSYKLLPALELHAGLGLAHQAHGSPVPLPSLSDIAIDAGLESAVQAEVGLGWQVFSDLSLSATYFRHVYDDMVYLELILDCEGNTDPQSAQELIMGIGGEGSICRGRGLPTADGLTQGIELLLKRELTERISGFLSYTLSFAEAIAADGTRFTPLSDVRHVANAVLRVDLGGGFALGARLHYRTGKMTPNRLFNSTFQRFERVEARLPSFFRADLHASYSWNVSFGRMEASIGVQNVTASTEATKRDCIVDFAGDRSNGRVPIVCTIDRQPAIVLPNLGIRAEL
ncbi:MAG TPA: TonB-dependent receptor, partial [Polyangiales bacterium]|nr:TonB-dependent receptor [Polyangiales bacterium]